MSIEFNSIQFNVFYHFFTMAGAEKKAAWITLRVPSTTNVSQKQKYMVLKPADALAFAYDRALVIFYDEKKTDWQAGAIYKMTWT